VSGGQVLSRERSVSDGGLAGFQTGGGGGGGGKR
jgi:hypothetical protein